MQDIAKLTRFIHRKYSTGLMSDTKWRVLFEALEEAGIYFNQAFVKFVESEEVRTIRPSSFDLSVPYAYMDTIEFGPIELRSIEWLELPDVAVLPRGNNFPALEIKQRTEEAAALLEPLR